MESAAFRGDIVWIVWIGGLSVARSRGGAGLLFARLSCRELVHRGRSVGTARETRGGYSLSHAGGCRRQRFDWRVGRRGDVTVSLFPFRRARTFRAGSHATGNPRAVPGCTESSNGN